MTIGQLIAFNMLANNVVNPLVALVFTASGYETFRLAKKKLSELEPPVEAVMPMADDQLDLVGDIVFKDVWFVDQYVDEAANTARPYILTAVEAGIEVVDTVNGAVDALQTWSAKVNPLNLLTNSN